MTERTLCDLEYAGATTGIQIAIQVKEVDDRIDICAYGKSHFSLPPEVAEKLALAILMRNAKVGTPKEVFVEPAIYLARDEFCQWCATIITEISVAGFKCDIAPEEFLVWDYWDQAYGPICPIPEIPKPPEPKPASERLREWRQQSLSRPVGDKVEAIFAAFDAIVADVEKLEGK